MSKNYWFKAKLFGWGWTPATIEGWACVAIYLLVITGTFAEDWNELVAPKAFIAQEAPTWVFATLALIAICYFKGERPRWRWPR